MILDAVELKCMWILLDHVQELAFAREGPTRWSASVRWSGGEHVGYGSSPGRALVDAYQAWKVQRLRG